MKKTYTRKQITEAIAYWKKKLNEDIGQEIPQDMIKALFVGVLHDNALDSGLYNDDGIYFQDDNSENDFIIKVADIQRKGNGYIATVLGGVDGKETDFGTMEINVKKMPPVDILFDELVDNINQYAQLSGDGTSQGMQNALDAHSEYVDELNENCKKKYTKKQISEAIAYWKKQLKKMN